MNHMHGVVLAAALSVAACATPRTKAELTIRSEPEGAYITEAGSGANFGLTPVVASYALPQAPDLPGGCYAVRPVEARWVSGARVTTTTIKVCGSRLGSYTFTVHRPPDAAGLDKDLEFALKLANSRAQQRQAQAAEDAAFAQTLRATAPQQPAVAPYPKPLNCESTRTGATVSTRCW